MQNTNRRRRGTLVHTTTSHTNINTHTYTRERVWKNHRLTGVKMKLQHRE